MKSKRSQTKVTNGELSVPKKITVYKHATGGNYSTTSTSRVDVGVSTNYTAGDEDETLVITLLALIRQATSGGFYLFLNVDGVEQDGCMYTTSALSWLRASRTYLVDVDANQTVNIKLQWYCSSGTAHISRSGSTHTPHFVIETYPRQAS